MQEIIINGSHRTNGDTAKLLDNYFPNIKRINLIEYKIDLYNYENLYHTNDHFITIIKVIIKYDCIIFATPVYWYSMSSILKIFFDRLTDLITVNKEIGYQLKNKKIKIVTISNGNNLGDNFFLPFIETSNYLGMNFVSGKHFINPII